MRPSRLLLSLGLTLLLGCHSRDRVHVETDEGPPHPAVMLSISDVKNSPQLLDGFYNLEDKSWRWTAGHFSVMLGTPSNAAEMGAILKVQLNVPQPLIDHVKTTALTASIGGISLTPESFTHAGAFTFVRDIPGKLLPDETARVDFALDRFLPSGTVDGRELGLVVTAIGFEPQTTRPNVP